jgi:hypothetical protein
MRRTTLVLMVLGTLAVPSAADAACPAPKHLTFSLAGGTADGRLSWRQAPRAPRRIRYRVSRDRRMVGETSGSHMRVRVRAGHSYWFVVRPLTRKGRPMLCWAQLRYRVRSRSASARSSSAR